MLENADEEWKPPKRKHTLNACGHQGGEIGGTLTQQRAPTVCSQGPVGYPNPQQRAPLACSQGKGEEGGPTTQQRA